MVDVKIEGNRNIANTGVIKCDCISTNTIINLDMSLINISDLEKILTMGDNEKEKSLVNMTEAQMKLANAIETFAKTELIRAEEGKLRAEAEIIRAKADENNSLANLNYSKIMLEDREVIKVMLEKLK